MKMGITSYLFVKYELLRVHDVWGVKCYTTKRVELDGHAWSSRAKLPARHVVKGCETAQPPHHTPHTVPDQVERIDDTRRNTSRPLGQRLPRSYNSYMCLPSSTLKACH